jgi:hypothetical protein
MEKTFQTAMYKHEDTIGEIEKAFQNANFTEVSLSETLFQILEKFYWKAVDEQKTTKELL